MLTGADTIARESSYSTWSDTGRGSPGLSAATSSQAGSRASSVLVCREESLDRKDVVSTTDPDADNLYDLNQQHADSPDGSSDGHSSKKLRPNRDPMSHRIIEKRRRDRMNNCLTNLSKLIPQTYLRKGRGRVEKTEIIEMAIRYMKQMQATERKRSKSGAEVITETKDLKEVVEADTVNKTYSLATAKTLDERYSQGFYDCIAETLRFLAGLHGTPVSDGLKAHLLQHLREYGARMINGATYPDDGVPSQAQMPTRHSGYFSAAYLNNATYNGTPLSAFAQLPRNPYSTSDYEYLPSNFVQAKAEPHSSVLCCEEPLNMSLKRSRLDNVGLAGSQLREILESTTKASNAAVHDAAATALGARSQHSERINRQDAMARPPTDLQAVPSDTTSHFSVQTQFTPRPGFLPHRPNGGAFGFHHVSVGGSSSSSSSHYPSSPSSSNNSSSSPRSPASTELASAGGGQSVPIFALHTSGLFYVPMTLNSSVLDPAAYHGSMTSMWGAEQSQICHPVTIPVYFSQCSPTFDKLGSCNSRKLGSSKWFERTPPRLVTSPIPYCPPSLHGQSHLPPQQRSVILAPASSTYPDSKPAHCF